MIFVQKTQYYNAMSFKCDFRTFPVFFWGKKSGRCYTFSKFI